MEKSNSARGRAKSDWDVKFGGSEVDEDSEGRGNFNGNPNVASKSTSSGSADPRKPLRASRVSAKKAETMILRQTHKGAIYWPKYVDPAMREAASGNQMWKGFGRVGRMVGLGYPSAAGIRIHLRMREDRREDEARKHLDRVRNGEVSVQYSFSAVLSESQSLGGRRYGGPSVQTIITKSAISVQASTKIE